jgi:acyl-homoserine lactone synthase
MTWSIDVVTAQNAYLYEDELDQLFQLRHRYFVDLKGWKDLAKVDGRERDQFDTERTVYLMLLDQGKVVGTHRLLPTTTPHLFSEVFSHYCNVRGVMRGPDILEAGRTCLDEKSLDRHALRRFRRQIMAALIEYPCHAGMRGFTTLCPLTVIHQYLKIGIQIEPLGVPVDIDGITCVACFWPTSDEDLAKVRRALNIPGAVLRYVGLDDSGPLERMPATIKRRPCQPGYVFKGDTHEL